MKVVVDQTVHIKMNEFYEIALQLHPTLDGKTIAKKIPNWIDWGIMQQSIIRLVSVLHGYKMAIGNA